MLFIISMQSAAGTFPSDQQKYLELPATTQTIWLNTQGQTEVIISLWKTPTTPFLRYAALQKSLMLNQNNMTPMPENDIGVS